MAANEDSGDAMRFSNGLPVDATDTDKKLFAKHCLSNYEKQGWYGDSLSEFYADDFAMYSESDFRLIDSDVRRNLRDLLRKRKVFVPKGRNVQIAGALYQVAQEEIPWPDEDPEHPEKEVEKNQRTTEDRARMDANKNNDINCTNATHRLKHEARQDVTRDLLFRPTRRGIMANLFKAYSNDDDKYGGSTVENFDRLFMLFGERCDQADIPEEDRDKAFSIMLKGNAQQYYFDHLKIQNLSLKELEESVKLRFQTPERTRALLREWDFLSLQSVFLSFPEKSPSDSLEYLVKKLSDIQTSLPSEYRNDIILRNKLLNEVKDIESCKLAYHKPADTIQGVISDLHASMATTVAQPKGHSDPSVNFVDRRLVRNITHNQHRQGRSKKCFVCGRPGCWSTNHTTKEKLNSYRKNKALRQFIASLDEHEETDEEDRDMAEALDDVAAHIINVESDDENNEASHQIFSHLATVDERDTSASFVARLQDSAFEHMVTKDIPRRFGNVFQGILVDTGAARGSTAGNLQYMAYCADTGQEPNIDSSSAARCHFGIGSTTSKGVAQISFPIGDIWLSFKAHVVEADVPILLSIDDMDRLGIYFDNLKNILVQPSTGLRSPILRVNGHPFIRWNSNTTCMLTTVELSRLHRRFGHPSTDKLMKVLERSDTKEVDANTRKILKTIERNCDACQRYAQKPRRFRFTLRDDKDFNHTIYADIFYIDAKPILHIVDEATYFQAARWLENMSSEVLWRALRMCWIDVYVGPPDMIAHDAGKHFMGAVFKANADMLHIRTKSIPVEAPHSMSIVERYHAPIRRAYNIIQKEAPNIDRDMALQMAVKAVNDSVGPDGLVPTLLVFGTLTRLDLPTDAPSPSTIQRAIALRKATAEVSKHFASRQVRDALKSRNGPDVTDIHTTPIGAPVLVYRPEKDQWDGPYSLLEISGENVTVLTAKGAIKFRSTVVKPYLTPETVEPHQAQDTTACNIALSKQTSDINSLQSHVSEHDFISFISIHVRTQNHLPDDNQPFAISRMLEFNGLLEHGVFRLVPASTAEGFRVYGSRFVDEVKNAGKPNAFEKSRLVIQAYKDSDHGLLTHAPTVQRVSQRLLLSLCAMDKNLVFFTRDVSQAYVQSETTTRRPIFVRPPSILDRPTDCLLQVERPLYGLPESGLHWFRTYHNHHIQRMKLEASIHDPCFLFTKHGMSSETCPSTAARGFTCLQTDDTATAGNKSFVELEKKMSEKFDCKEAKFLHNESTLFFNGANINLHDNVYGLTQPDHISRLSAVPEEMPNKGEFVSQRARGAYVAAVCRPDVAFGFAQCSQMTNPNASAAKFLNKVINMAQKTTNRGLKFVSLDKKSIRLAVFADASFASNPDLSSQLGFIIVLADCHGNANVLHYSSVKSKRITRSVLAAELFAAVNAFDSASTLRVTMNRIFGKHIPLVLYTDSKSLFDSVVGINATTEKRLLIDLCVLRQSYEIRELSEIVWIPSAENPADALTKMNCTNALELLMENNKLCINPKSWVERPLTQIHKSPDTEKIFPNSEKRKTREDPRLHRST